MAAIYKNYILNKNSEIETLFHQSFTECAKSITSMDTLKKADIAAQIEPILTNLYETANKFGNPNFSRDEQISPDVFNLVMGKIKRWETILYWLYEIDILMQETDLDQIIAAEEKRLAEHDGFGPCVTPRQIMRPRKKPDPTKSELVKDTIFISTQDNLNELYAQRNARGCNTDAIMAMAAELTIKYHK